MKILIPVIVGAIIGYFTNWLAIKMLFRPHYEKRIMGIKIPFTPGLIPKERDRIAKTIGETVGVYLLSPETIIESLGNQRTDERVKSWLEGKINKLKENQISIKEFLQESLGENYYKLMEKIKAVLNNIIISQIRGDKFKSLLIKSMEDKINNINTENIYTLVDENLRRFIIRLSNSQELKDRLTNQLKLKIDELSQDERKLSELVPKEILNSLNQYIEENGDKIGESIKESFKDPIVQKKLKDSISDLVFQNIPKMIMAFISPDVIAEKIFHMIEKYIDSEDANKSIVMIVNSSIDRLLASKTSEITLKITEDIGEEGLTRIGDIIIKYISKEENHEILLNLIQNNLRNSELDNKRNILDYLNKNIDTILNSIELENSISKFTSDIIEEFLNKPISYMAEKIDDNFIGSIYDLGRNIFEKFAINELPHIIELFNISQIVEEKLNSFSVDFVEELILDIANKELKAITWLGGLLGGILGILSPLIQMLY